eukprot:gnl/Ergobibamus_cyprinoides/364.p1 GENE.gnl/Ergobibamus_cyprinoides/364~~gnl/Ergobibamus_cyprinoides/364.p1  ORF type:complete len:282 (+),score=43.32 gnl/Ergobibamus_cyprinoides/364:462-1307(+)
MDAPMDATTEAPAAQSQVAEAPEVPVVSSAATEEAAESSGNPHAGEKRAGPTTPATPEYKGTVVYVPCISAVVSKFKLSEELALKSVQMDGEELLPMSRLRMGWSLLQTPEERDAMVGASGAKAKRLAATRRRFFLECRQRIGGGVANMPADKKKAYEYALPYVFVPKEAIAEAKAETGSVIPVKLTLRDRELSGLFDYQFDEMDEFVPEFLLTTSSRTPPMKRKPLSRPPPRRRMSLRARPRRTSSLPSRPALRPWVPSAARRLTPLSATSSTRPPRGSI